MKKSLKVFGISILILILFRGVIYRLLIKYSDIGIRTEIEISNRELIEAIELKSSNRNIDFKEIIKIADEITNEELSFTTSRASNDPNELIRTKRAICIGYSAMFNSIANYLIRRNRLQSEIKAEHKIGQLNLFGINLHQFFESSFLAYHDFNELKNIKTNEVILIDPTSSDYLSIKSVSKAQ